MGLAGISWAALSPPETAGLMERWENQRAVRVPWLAARLERAGRTLTFDRCGVSAVGDWCTQWFAAPDGIDDQPPVVWLEERIGARLPCSPEATVVADAVGGFVESVLWAEQEHAQRLYAPGTGRGGRALVGANEPGLGYLDPVDEPPPFQLMQTVRGVALRGTRGRDLVHDLVHEHDTARARLVADRERAVRV